MNALARWPLLALLMVVLVPLANADDDDREDLVSFQVEAGRDVDNDRVTALLSATAENRDPSKLAEQINSDMQWAIQQLKPYGEIKLQSGTYQTYPVYDDRKIVRWRGRQDLQLETGAVDKMSKALGELQARLQMQSLQFSVSEQKRSNIESELIEEALAAFGQRAELVSRSLKAEDYSLVDMSIHTGGVRRPVPMRAEAASVMSKASVQAPAIEQGTSRISVQVNGRIQLERD